MFPLPPSPLPIIFDVVAHLHWYARGKSHDTGILCLFYVDSSIRTEGVCIPSKMVFSRNDNIPSIPVCDGPTVKIPLSPFHRTCLHGMKATVTTSIVGGDVAIYQSCVTPLRAEDLCICGRKSVRDLPGGREVGTTPATRVVLR